MDYGKVGVDVRHPRAGHTPAVPSSMDLGSGFGALIGFSLLVPVALLGVVILGIVALAGGREPDPTGQRQRATYLAAVCFVAIITLLFAGFGAVSSVVGLIGDDEQPTIGTSGRSSGSFSVNEDGEVEEDEDGFSFSGPDSSVEEDNRTENAVSGVMASLVIVVAAGVLYLFHRKLMQELIDAPDFATGPARRALNGYAYAVSFVAAIIALGAAAAVLYALYRVAAPDFSAPDTDGERESGLRQLLSSAALALGALAMFRAHFTMGERWTRPALAAAPAAAPGSGTEPPPVA